MTYWEQAISASCSWEQAISALILPPIKKKDEMYVKISQNEIKIKDCKWETSPKQDI